MTALTLTAEPITLWYPTSDFGLVGSNKTLKEKTGAIEEESVR